MSSTAYGLQTCQGGWKDLEISNPLTMRRVFDYSWQGAMSVDSTMGRLVSGFSAQPRVAGIVQKLLVGPLTLLNDPAAMLGAKHSTGNWP